MRRGSGFCPWFSSAGWWRSSFPQFHGQDLFFPEAARAGLNAAGIRVRNSAEMEREERALFDSALTRATMLVTLSYPETDARGERNLRSGYLDDWTIEEQASQTVRLRPRRLPEAEGTPAGIRSPRLLQYLAQRTAKVSPTSLESYLQCPFQYFGSRLMRLQPAPPRPVERLDFLTQGNIVHEVLARWYAQPGDVTALFEEVFARILEEKQIPAGYHTERLRNAMLDDLILFTRAERFPPGTFESRMEEKFEFPLDDSLAISGKIDRLDIAADGTAYVIDYKYSNAQNTKSKLDNEKSVAGPVLPDGSREGFRSEGGRHVLHRAEGRHPECRVGSRGSGAWLARQGSRANHRNCRQDPRRPPRRGALRPGQVPLLRLRRRVPRRNRTAANDCGGRVKEVKYTPAQLAAIDTAQRHRDACVVAGPGSGKTTVLVEYFRRLVKGAPTRCAFWPSPSPRRRPAICVRAWLRRSARMRRSAPGWSAPGYRPCMDSARVYCARTPSSRGSTRSSGSPMSARAGACSRTPWRMRSAACWPSIRERCGR
ncbi:MAG: PD-(D/E)XK nuclease family protein [Ignavibacteriota bacterium]